MSTEQESTDIRLTLTVLIKGLCLVLIVLFVASAQCTMVNRQVRQHSQDLAIAIVASGSEQNKADMIDSLCMTTVNNKPTPVSSNMCDILLKMKTTKEEKKK